MYADLSKFIERLRSEGELLEITAPVDPVLEIAEITDRMSKQPGGGKALLFANTGTDFPVITNMLGSDRRISLALGVDSPDELSGRIYELFSQVTAPKAGLGDKIKMLPLLGKMSKWLPKTRKGRGECQQVVMKSPDLAKLPILKCWPHDGGRFVTLPMVNTKDPVSGIRNVGMYRMQVFSADSTGMHWHRHKTGARHYEEYKKLGQRMPVSVCIGGDPAYTYAATAPVPDNIDEYLLAGFIRQKPVELVKCLTNDLEVPADCDFVIEGYVDPAEEKVVEGPFGDHTGFYSLADRYPVFHVTCITHKRNAVYPATIVGIPPQEDVYISKATERIFLAPIRLVMQPEIRDLWMPEEGVSHNLAVVNIDKSYPGQGFKVANSMWGAGQMMFNKFLIVTSSGGENIHSTDTRRKALENVQIPRDVMFSKGPLDVLDHTSDVMGYGGKMCIDATVKLPDEYLLTPENEVKIPAEWSLSEGLLRINDNYAKSWRALFVSVDSEGRSSDYYVSAVTRMLADSGASGIKFVFLYDKNVALDDVSTLLWLAGGNCDGVRDVTAAGSTLIFDARVKSGGINGFPRVFPNVVVSSEETIRKVNERWNEYGLGELIESPSLKYMPLVRGKEAEIENT